MSLTITGYQADGRTGVVTIANDNKNFANAITELSGSETRRVAIAKAASAGLPDPRINGLAAPYAVNAAGEPITKPGEKIDHYRIDIPVTTGR